MQKIGYLVTANSQVMHLDAQDGLLYFSAGATLFRSRARAKKAIARTLADRPTFESEFGRLFIQVVQPEPEGRSYQITVDYK